MAATKVFVLAPCFTLADICLVPQLANARRFKRDVARWPRLAEIDARARALPAFAAAAPEDQPAANWAENRKILAQRALTTAAAAV